MYEEFFGFKEKPFSLTPDPKFIYLSKKHQGALDHMLYGIRQREGFMTIVGDVGTGKTTLCRCLLDRMDATVEVALILNPMLSDMDLLKTCIQDLRIEPVKGRAESLVGAEARVDKVVRLHNPPAEEDLKEYENWFENASKRELLDALNDFLLNRHREGKTTVLIVDEAQNLPLDVMELLRLLSNLETEKEKLLQIIFVGQLELNDKLKLPELKQLNQRISIRYEITPLGREETAHYISHRILVAGGASSVTFARAAVGELYNYSRGYPRLINLVCDRALLAGYNHETDLIGRNHVRQGIRSLLGEEDKDPFLRQFLKNRLPVIGSVLFFLLGLAFFLASRDSPPLQFLHQTVGSVLKGLEAPDSSGEVRPSRAVPAKKTTGETLGQAPATPPSLSGKAAPAETSDPVAGGPSSQAEIYQIKLSTVDDLNRVTEQVKALQEDGFKAFWKKVVIEGRDRYMIYIGPFNNLSDAKINLKALKYAGLNPILFSVSQFD